MQNDAPLLMIFYNWNGYVTFGHKQHQILHECFLPQIFFLMWVFTSKMVCDSFVSKISSLLGVFLTYFLCNFYCIKCCPSCPHICMFKDQMFFQWCSSIILVVSHNTFLFFYGVIWTTMGLGDRMAFHAPHHLCNS